MKIQDIFNVPKYAGVYMLKNTVTGNTYIGKAIKLRQSLVAQFRKLDENINVYKELKEYGLDSFEFKILRTFTDALSWETKQALDFWEKRYLEEYNGILIN